MSIKDKVKGAASSIMTATTNVNQALVMAMAAAVTALPMSAMAAGGGPFDNILTNISDMAIVVVGIAGVLIVASKAFKFIKGDGGVMDIIKPVIFTLIIIALIVVFKGASGLSSTFGEIGNSAVGAVGDAASNALG